MFCSLFWCNYLIAFPWRSGGFDSQNSQCDSNATELKWSTPCESRGFLRALRFPPTRKLTGCVRIKTDMEVKSQYCKNS